MELSNFLVNQNPGRFPLTQCEQRAPNPDHQRIAEGGRVRHDHFFAGSKSKIEEAAAILAGPFQAFDSEPSVPGDFRQLPVAGYQMKTIIIFNYHALNMPELRT